MDWCRWLLGTSGSTEVEDESIAEPSKPKDAIAYNKRKPFTEIKADLLRSGKLFYDAHFPAKNTSLYFSKDPPVPIVWKRPHEIVDHPRLFADGASRFDIAQGVLGDCWLLASIASLCDNKTLFHHVVPHDQDFSHEYCGIFRFRFWRFGRWTEVVVDDRLPTHKGRLLFLHSTDNTEFWSALLEKAYAKVHGSYEGLSGGHASEAMVDFTGGVTQSYDLRGKQPDDLFEILLNVQNKQSLVCAAINQMKGKEIEFKLDNGLVMGHAYTVSAAARVSTRGYELLRIRNPWGDAQEWNGPWCDGSGEWSNLTAEEKEDLDLAFHNDGESWMSFVDFCANFDRIEICLLSPTVDNISDTSVDAWTMELHEGTWQKHVSAGGCRMFPDTFHLNPQFKISLEYPDDDTDDEKSCTVVLGLMQKARRKNLKQPRQNLSIGFAIYQLKEDSSRYLQNGRLNQEFFLYHPSFARTETFLNSREMTGRFSLPQGEYVVVPSTFSPGEEGDFVMRMFSEKPNTARTMESEANIDTTVEEVDKEENHAFDKKFKKIFDQAAGKDGEIDPFEFHDVVTTILKKEGRSFTFDATRSIFNMADIDRTGKVDYNEFRLVWQRIKDWENTFETSRKNWNGDMVLTELRSAFDRLGFHLPTSSLTSVASRWGTRDGGITLEDFLHICSRIRSVYEYYNSLENPMFSVNDFIVQAIYL